MPARCPSCTEVGTLTCKQCHNVQYCSSICQQADWQFHKILCKTFKSFGDSHRPSQDARRVIYFDFKAERPTFVWLKIRDVKGGRWGSDYQTLEFKSLLKSDRHWREYHYSRNCLLDTPQAMEIAWRFDDAFLLDYDTPNRALLAAANNKAGLSWRGPLLAYCGSIVDAGMIQDTCEIRDMDMSLFSDLMANLIAHEIRDDPGNPLRGPKVKAVRTLCHGELRTKGGPYAQCIEIPRLHPIFQVQTLSQFSQMIGTPLILAKEVKKSYPEEGRTTLGDHCNQRITFMLLDCDPYAKFKGRLDLFGFAPFNWMGGEVPNTLVARLDREPVDPDHVQAFGDFCIHRIQPLFQWANEIGSDSGRRFVLDQNTSARWAASLQQWRENKAVAVAPDVRSLFEDHRPDVYDPYHAFNDAQKKDLERRLYDDEGMSRREADLRARM